MGLSSYGVIKNVLYQFQILACVTSRIDSAGDPIGFDLKYTFVNYLTLLGISGVINKKSPLIFSDGP